MNILQPLFAQTYEYSNGICKVDGIIQASTQPCEDAGKLFLGVAAAIFIPIFLIILLFLVFWIIALVHVLSHENIENRVIWIVVLIASFFIGLNGIAAIVYYFVVMRPLKKAKNAAPPAANAAAQSTEPSPTLNSTEPSANNPETSAPAPDQSTQEVANVTPNEPSQESNSVDGNNDKAI